MLLAIDIGNTNIVLGLFRERELLHHWRVGTRRDGTADEYGILLKNLFEVVGIHPSAVSGVIIASVVPPLQPVFEELTSAHFRVAPVVVGPGIRTGMPILYDNPREVGADRIVNAVAAYETYGGPAIVVDFGTATTFDAISAKGEYLGGVIAPGVG
ncbi:MAG: type III pantothenate kinase, partial [Candidatus Methylomirabilales bacterium]